MQIKEIASPGVGVGVGSGRGVGSGSGVGEDDGAEVGWCQPQDAQKCNVIYRITSSSVNTSTSNIEYYII